MQDPTQTLLRSPMLPRHLERLQRVLEEEAARRQRFVDELSPSQKAEFINGEIVMHTPARVRHVAGVTRLTALLTAYVQRHGLGLVLAEKALVSLTRNDYEPDVCFFGREKAEAIAPDQVRLPAPDLAVEVLSPATEATDRGVKFEDYAAHGVGEYWIVDPEAEVLEQYVLEEGGGAGAYVLRMKSGTGEVASTAVEGLVAPVRALFEDAANVEALRALLA